MSKENKANGGSRSQHPTTWCNYFWRGDRLAVCWRCLLCRTHTCGPPLPNPQFQFPFFFLLFLAKVSTNLICGFKFM